MKTNNNYRKQSCLLTNWLYLLFFFSKCTLQCRNLPQDAFYQEITAQIYEGLKISLSTDYDGRMLKTTDMLLIIEWITHSEKRLFSELHKNKRAMEGRKILWDRLWGEQCAQQNNRLNCISSTKMCLYVMGLPFHPAHGLKHTQTSGRIHMLKGASGEKGWGRPDVW